LLPPITYYYYCFDNLPFPMPAGGEPEIPILPMPTAFALTEQDEIRKRNGTRPL